MSFSDIPAELQAMRQSGIYQIVNSVNGKRYIGSAVNILKRWQYHISFLRRNIHSNSYLQAAWNKYNGETTFNFQILEYCSKENLVAREQYWIDLLKSYECGYNLRPKANSMAGFKHSEETKIKVYEGKKAGKGFKHSEETKAKLRFKKPEMSERMKGNTHNKRNKEKWPHEKGSKCRCGECHFKRSEYMLNWKYEQGFIK